MNSRLLAMTLVLALGVWLVPATPAHAALKLATLNVKGMVCQA